jgi:hypothetical protein
VKALSLPLAYLTGSGRPRGRGHLGALAGRAISIIGAMMDINDAPLLLAELTVERGLLAAGARRAGTRDGGPGREMLRNRTAPCGEPAVRQGRSVLTVY